MDKLTTVKTLLSDVGMPKAQQSDLCAYVILAMANISSRTSFENATNEWVRIHDIIAFINKYYRKSYAENSRETFRKQALHHFRTAAIVEDNGQSTNSPNYKWRLTQDFLPIVRTIGKESANLENFIAHHTKLVDIYASKKKIQKIPVKINGEDFTFSIGNHNLLQRAIIEEFAPRFAPNAEVLYVGDTIAKDLVKNISQLSHLGFTITTHEKMPDVVLYKEDKGWIFFVEAVTSVGPMSPKRINELEQMTTNVNAGKIYVTAFLNFATFKKFSDQLAWDTEVWIADMPDHMIHLNGDKFLGPRS